MVRTRIIYPSAAVWVNGSVLHRVQTVGSTTTFTTEDLFELGTQNIIDVLDDVPAVAVTIDTSDYGSIKTVGALAGLDLSNIGDTAAIGNANLVVMSGTTPLDYLHGVRLLDFATSSCNGLPGFDVWVPVQDECSIGTDTNTIDMTMYLPSCFVNSINLNYAVGANATENYAAETDAKLWLLNDGRYVTYEKLTVTGAANSMTLAIEGVVGELGVATLSDGSPGFLKTDVDGNRAVVLRKMSPAGVHRIPVEAGTVAAAETFVYNSATNVLFFPTSTSNPDYDPDNGDIIEVTYASNVAGDEALNGANRVVASHYYDDTGVETAAGGLRQGQVEAYIIDPSWNTDWERALRLQTVTISADLTRERLLELGRLRAYDRPATVPIPIRVTVELTASDLRQWAIFAGKIDAFDNATLDDIDIFDLLDKKDSILVVKMFRQTDQDAGGSGLSRKVLTDKLLGEDYSDNGDVGTYAATVQDPPERERALKTVIVPNLVITEEGFNVSVGQNARQTFNFRARNELLWVQGDFDFEYLLMNPGIVKND